MDNYSLEPKWYVAHTYSGYENKVKDNIEKIVENRKLGELIVDIRIPVETTVEADGDKEKTVESKVFPSYVLVKMVMNDNTWHVIRNIRGVTGFVGPGSRPVALTDAEVAALGIEDPSAISEAKKKDEFKFSVGDMVELRTGAFAGNIGKLMDISEDGQSVTVSVTMFGREAPLPLKISDIGPIED